jgi:hypothetical protein
MLTLMPVGAKALANAGRRHKAQAEIFMVIENRKITETGRHTINTSNAKRWVGRAEDTIRFWRLAGWILLAVG